MPFKLILLTRSCCLMSGLIPFNRRGRRLAKSGYDNMSNMIEDFFNYSGLSETLSPLDSFKVDVKENDKEYLVEAEMAGINKEDIDISLDDGMLSISAKKEDKEETEEDKFIHRERHYSEMQRSLYLADAKPDGVNAKLENGLLKITVEKAQRNKSRRIEIE